MLAIPDALTEGRGRFRVNARQMLALTAQAYPAGRVVRRLQPEFSPVRLRHRNGVVGAG